MQLLSRVLILWALLQDGNALLASRWRRRRTVLTAVSQKALETLCVYHSPVFIDLRLENEATEHSFSKPVIHLPSTLGTAMNSIIDGEYQLPREKDTCIMVFCDSGKRAEAAKLALEKLGFENVVAGGVDEVARAVSSAEERIALQKKRKQAFLETFKENKQEPKNANVSRAISKLAPLSPSQHMSEAELQNAIQGAWVSISRPDFPDCKGQNAAGDLLFTLGRMTFGALSPQHILCSIQSISNSISTTPVAPQEIIRHESDPDLLSYNIEALFTVEDDGPCIGVAGLLTTKGYCMLDPEVPSRLTVWFQRGGIQPDISKDETAKHKWKSVFGSSVEPLRRRNWVQEILPYLKRWLIGMEFTDSTNYNFKRPVGGHGKAFLDILYLDDDLRITRGNRGSIVVARRKDHSP